MDAGPYASGISEQMATEYSYAHDFTILFPILSPFKEGLKGLKISHEGI